LARTLSQIWLFWGRIGLTGIRVPFAARSRGWRTTTVLN